MAESLGDILPRILARAETMMGFQEMLNSIPDRGHRKTRILDLWRIGEVTRDEAEMLIQAHMLETD